MPMKHRSLIIFLYFSLRIDKQTTIYTIYFFTQGNGSLKKYSIFKFFIKHFRDILPIQKKMFVHIILLLLVKMLSWHILTLYNTCI